MAAVLCWHLLVAYPSLMTDTGVVVTSVVSSGTSGVLLIKPHWSVDISSNRWHSWWLQSVSRVEVFNVSDGDFSYEGCVESGQEFSKSISKQLPPALDKLSSQLSAELILSRRDAVRGQAALRRYSDVFAETSSQLGTTGLTKQDRYWLCLTNPPTA